MRIEIMEKPTVHGWVVCLDALQVNFNSLEEAQAFVDQLKARIDAPRAWPVSRPAAFTSRRPAQRTASPKDEQACMNLVE